MVGVQSFSLQSFSPSLLERQATYRALFDHSVPHEGTEALRAHTQKQRALGSERFRALVEALTQRAARSGQGGGRLTCVNEPDLIFAIFAGYFSLRSFAAGQLRSKDGTLRCPGSVQQELLLRDDDQAPTDRSSL